MNQRLTIFPAVVLLVRVFLLLFHRSDQTQHFFHVDAHCIPTPELCQKPLRRFRPFHNHEYHFPPLYHLPLQPRQVRTDSPDPPGLSC